MAIDDDRFEISSRGYVRVGELELDKQYLKQELKDKAGYTPEVGEEISGELKRVERRLKYGGYAPEYEPEFLKPESHIDSQSREKASSSDKGHNK